ncbi:hypothetical protein C8Q75DRAFT_804176 [Abortiporus biennis]|nr:hypothetical protein C8Q75DRAFT_804176 [Abortiporus biennis]
MPSFVTNPLSYINKGIDKVLPRQTSTVKQIKTSDPQSASSMLAQILKVQAEVKVSENTDLSEKLRNVQTEYIKVSLKLAETESILFDEASIWDSQEKTLRNTVAELEGTRSQLATDLENLKENHVNLHAEHNTLSVEHTRCPVLRDQAIAMEKIAFNALNESFETIQHQNAVLIAEKTSLQAANASLAVAYNEQQVLMTAAQKDLEDKHDENIKLTTTLKEAMDVKLQYQLERDAALAEVETLKAQLQEAFATKAQEVQSLMREKNALAFELSVTKDQLDATRSDLNDLTEVQYELDDCRAEVFTLNTQMEELQQSNSSLGAQLDAERIAHEVTRKDLSDVQMQLLAVTYARDQYHSELDRVQVELESSKKAVDDLVLFKLSVLEAKASTDIHTMEQRGFKPLSTIDLNVGTPRKHDVVVGKENIGSRGRLSGQTFESRASSLPIPVSTSSNSTKSQSSTVGRNSSFASRIFGSRQRSSIGSFDANT